MRSLVALALLVLGVAVAHHSPEHKLKLPRFEPQKTHLYDVWMNVTSGIPGLHPQVSKSVRHMELKVYAGTPRDIIISMEKVMVSQSLESQSSDTEAVNMKPDRSLEEKLRIPIKAQVEDGMIVSYTLDQSESVESAKIKRTILRNLEIYVDREYLQGENKYYPVTYNQTKDTPWGNYSSHYVIESSPYVDFPQDLNVWNITRHDNLETLPYLAYEQHHNYEKQGCPEVCKRNNTEWNEYGPGCPVGYEPFNTPLKKSFSQQHDLRMLKNGEYVIDKVTTKETHVANLYDQDMEIAIKTTIKYRKTVSDVITERNGQQVYSELNDLTKEMNQEEIHEVCGHPEPREAVEAAKTLLKDITEIIVEGEIDSQKSKFLGEKIILLQKALQVLRQEDFKTLQEYIVSYEQLRRAPEEEKVKRQIWLDALPVVGTAESVSYIVQLIQENANSPRYLSLWEAKTILEALPLNIINPTERTITELSRLLEVVENKETRGYKFFYSASHLAVSRVVRRLCSIDNGTNDEEESMSQQRNIQREFMLRRRSTEYNQYKKCPKGVTKKFVQDVVEKLRNTQEKTKMVIYIQTLARTGLDEVLPVLKKYVYGKFDGYTLKYTDYIRSVTIHALYHFSSSHPEKITEIVYPIFMNKTEVPRIRTGAFGVLLNSQPSLGLLQQIAAHTWKESSLEVGSYVRSTLETYGNSTIPCHQLTASRIQKVLSQVKRVYEGNQKSRNQFWGYYDKLRNLGFEQRYEFTASNESFIPAVIYQSFGYNADSLKDILYQVAINSQGFTTSDWYDSVFDILGLEKPQDIPKDKESEIYKEADIAARGTEFWRYTFYDKLFYSSSYYYFDAEETNIQEFYDILKEYATTYFSWTPEGKMEGHIVKMYLPSSYHAKAIAKSLPSHMEFEMKNPIVLSLRLKMKPESASSGWTKYSMDVRPTVFFTSLYTHQYLNLGDCKDIGVYHQRRVALTYPVQLTFEMHRSGKMAVAYSFPQLPKTVVAYHSDSGSFAGKKELLSLPVMKQREVYKTIPVQFVKRAEIPMIAMPNMVSEILTEDIQLGTEEIQPRNVEEITYWAVKKFLNVGWRRQSVHIKRVSDGVWSPSTEMKLNFNYSTEFIQPRNPSEDDWTRDLKFEDSLRSSQSSYTEEGRTIYKKLSEKLSHVEHRLHLDVEQVKGSRAQPFAQLHLHYNHTLGGFLHLMHLQAYWNRPSRPLEITADWGLAFTQRPNEFKYGSQSYGKQKALAIGALSFTNTSTPFRHPEIVVKSVFGWKPLETVLRNEMSPSPSREHFYPETHEQCVEDVRNGKPWSVECMKAIREWAQFNTLRMHAVWEKELPTPIRKCVYHVDLLLKHVFYHHMNFEKKDSQARELRVEATYIDQMTEQPVVDILVQKPQETIEIKKLSTSWLRPLNSINNAFETYFSEVTNNTYPATCVLMDKYVRTFDLMSYRLPSEMPACTYVLATHCIDSKKFAVIVKVDPHTSTTEEVHIYIGEDKLVLTPGRREYRIRFNGQEETIREHKPQMWNEESKIYAFVHQVADGSYYLEVHAEKHGFKVVYDGLNVKLQVHPRYRGEMCGLCSEFDGEQVRELRGVDRCLYSHPLDFVKSAMVDTCGDRQPKHSYICNDEDIEDKKRSWISRDDDEDDDEDDEEHEPTMKRNVVLSREGQLCFSTQPVSMCENQASPRQSRSQEMDFHCLPKQDRNARKLVTESKRRILGELETKSVDRRESVQVAIRC